MNTFGEERVTWREGGHRFNRRAFVTLREVEKRLDHEVHVFQGSFSTVVKQSAKTHAGRGAVDLNGRGNWAHEVRVMREVGWVAWHRPTMSPEHIRAVLRGDPLLHADAKEQVRDWERGGDGLQGDGRDNGPDVDIPVFPLDVVPPLPGSLRPRGLKPLDLSNVLMALHRSLAGRPRLAVTRIQRALNAALGTNLLDDGLAGPVTKAAYTRYQKKIRLTSNAANGVPGVESLTKLGRKDGGSSSTRGNHG